MSGRLNLLFLRDTTFVCGPGKTILNTYRTLDRTRFTLTLGVPVTGDASNDFIDRARAIGLEALPIQSRGRVDALAILRLVRLLKHRRIDILQSHDFKTRRLAVPAAALAGMCHVTSVHGWITNTRKQIIARRVDQALIRRARCAIAVSAQLGRRLVDEANVASERVALLPNAVLLDDYPPAVDARTARLELGLPADAEIVSIIGRLSPEKGLALFLEMAQRVAAGRPGVRFLVVGGGALRSGLEAQAAALGLRDRVVFLGHREDMDRVYAACTVVALCSSTEGLPNVLLEAFAHRRTVVATRVGGVPEIVTDGVDGFLVEPGRPEPLAAAVLRLVQNPDLASAMGRRGRAAVEARFDFSRRTRELEMLYESLVVRTPEPARRPAQGTAGGTQ